jgi:hypothetical protein
MSKAGDAIYEGLVEPEYLALENYDRVEEEGISTGMLGKWTLWFLVVTAVIIILSYYYSVVNLMGHRDELAIGAVYPERIEMEQETVEKLTQYGYNAGNYTIPIDKAMELVANEKAKTVQSVVPVEASTQP